MASMTVSAVLRSNQARYAQLAEPRSLEWGIAYTSERYAGLHEANQFREISFDDPGVLPQAYQAVEVYFAERGLRCRRWAPAADQGMGELERFLMAKGFVRRDRWAMVARTWLEEPPPAGVRIVPARAMRKAVEQILGERFRGQDPAIWASRAEAFGERMDDPQTESSVAMQDGAPAGVCTFFQVGDIGRITDVYVVPGQRRRRVGRALVGHMLRQARRLAMRITCGEVSIDNEAGVALCGRCGFEPDGQVSEFYSSSAGDGDD